MDRGIILYFISYSTLNLIDLFLIKKHLIKHQLVDNISHEQGCMSEDRKRNFIKGALHWFLYDKDNLLHTLSTTQPVVYCLLWLWRGFSNLKQNSYDDDASLPNH